MEENSIKNERSSIEEYVKILERFSNENVIYGSTVGMTLEKYKDLQISAEHILSDYRRVLKENKELKDTNCLVKRYFKLKDTNTYLQKENDELKKENEELKQYLITQNCEINRLNLDKIRLELLQVPDTTEQYKYLKNEYKMRLERTDLENYKLNYISIQKVKDKIEELKKNLHTVEHYETVGAIHALQELIEGRKLEEDKL